MSFCLSDRKENTYYTNNERLEKNGILWQYAHPLTCDSRTASGGIRRRRSAVASRQTIRLAQRSALSGHFSSKASGFWAEMPVPPAALRNAARSVLVFSARRQAFGAKRRKPSLRGVVTFNNRYFALSRHFRPLLTARLLLTAVKPSLLRVFDGSAVMVKCKRRN